MRASKATALLFVAMVVSGCRFVAVPEPSVSLRDAEYMSLVPNAIIDIQFERYEVDDPTGEAPGTIVVDTRERFLYLVLPNKRAIRYGVAVGEEAFGWTGTASVARKAEWPTWTPPGEMLVRWPHLRPHAGGMKGEPENPLGARALYLYQEIATRCTASTAPMSRKRSVMPSPRAAFACGISTSSIFTTAPPSARR